MDEKFLEVAEHLSNGEINAGVANARAAIPKVPEGFEGRCVDCDLDIPPERLRTGAITCIHCQTKRERPNTFRSRVSPHRV